jgi:hypothetical protein
MVVFLDSTVPDTRSSVDSWWGAKQPTATSAWWGPSVGFWRALTVSSANHHTAVTLHLPASPDIQRAFDSLPERCSFRRCSYLNSGTSGKFLWGSKNSFHLVMCCFCRSCTFPKADESKLPTPAFRSLQVRSSRPKEAMQSTFRTLILSLLSSKKRRSVQRQEVERQLAKDKAPAR